MILKSRSSAHLGAQATETPGARRRDRFLLWLRCGVGDTARAAAGDRTFGVRELSLARGHRQPADWTRARCQHAHRTTRARHRRCQCSGWQRLGFGAGERHRRGRRPRMGSGRPDPDPFRVARGRRQRRVRAARFRRRSRVADGLGSAARGRRFRPAGPHDRHPFGPGATSAPRATERRRRLLGRGVLRIRPRRQGARLDSAKARSRPTPSYRRGNVTSRSPSPPCSRSCLSRSACSFQSSRATISQDLPRRLR